MKTDHPHHHEGLPKDEFGRGESWQWIVIVAVPVIIALLALVLRKADTGPAPVIVYCAQDMNYAEPLLREFEKASGLRVKAVYDSEAVKTVGLANRLLAERTNPRCDLFWGNEELRTRQLAAANVFRETNGWAAFGYRSRRIVVNTNKLSATEVPTSLLDLTNATWRGKVAMAYPQFGTTATHFHALRQHWGAEQWSNWCKAMAANQPLLVDGNSSVVKMVARGAAVIGLTDSDDIIAAQQQGAPIEALPVTPETLLIPNTAGLVQKQQPNPGTDVLFIYLQDFRTVEKLVTAGALEGAGALPGDVETLKPDWEALLQDLDATSAELGRIFLR